MKKYLSEMLYALTSAYTRRDYGNCGGESCLKQRSESCFPYSPGDWMLSRSRPNWSGCGMTLTMPAGLFWTDMVQTLELSASAVTTGFIAWRSKSR